MTSGRLAAVDVTGGTNTLIYTNPGSKSFEITLNVNNRNNSDVEISIAFVDGVLADLVDADWIESNVTVRANGGIERDGIGITPGQSIIGYSNTSNVSFQVWE